MARDNVFKFRSLKWGDPDEKFKLLAEDLAGDSYKSDRWRLPMAPFDIALVIFTLISVAVSLVLLVT